MAVRVVPAVMVVLAGVVTVTVMAVVLLVMNGVDYFLSRFGSGMK